MTSYSTRLNDTLSPRNDNVYVVPHHKLTRASTVVSLKIRTRDFFFKRPGKIKDSPSQPWQIRSVLFETLSIRHFYFVENVFQECEVLCKNLKIWKNEWDHPQMQYSICIWIPNVIREFIYVLWLFTQSSINILAYQVGYKYNPIPSFDLHVLKPSLPNLKGSQKEPELGPSNLLTNKETKKLNRFNLSWNRSTNNVITAYNRNRNTKARPVQTRMRKCLMTRPC